MTQLLLTCIYITKQLWSKLYRFRFKVEVFDGRDSAVFLLFDLEAELLTGFSCEKLLNTIEIENKVIPDGDYPDDIEERLAGKEMLFKVCNNSRVKHDRDDCFQILRICTNLGIIAMFHEHDVLVTPKQAKFSPPLVRWT
ncbi:uncharacterized protein LOC130745936 isoform X2 [Lotus japonicus]|uniref:uncharacterized protein LOC130745936 isoform X2 n=1 Tax=Lotus japonicus TaxID=34305 RepID=UPI00258E1403|nr:uncharacterized protein LOC130745936 isoform X2 [Lotus japonicus]